MILEAALDRGLSDRDLSTVEKVGMDEKSFLRGQCYVTTLCDLEKVRVIEVVEGRKEEDARSWAIGAAQGVLKCPGEGFAESHFERWYAWAIRSRLKPVKRVARMLRRQLHGLLAYFRHWITNAAVEGLDSKIQAIKWLAAINGKCRITPGPVQTWTAV